MKPYLKLLLLLLVASWASASLAEILNSNTAFIRIRLGSNGNGADTVVYDASIPSSMGGLPGVSAQPDAVSTNAVAGGSGIYRVRVVTDLNARDGIVPLRGEFSYNSSTPLQCSTPATCGTASIPFTRIRWNARDNDTWNTVFRFDGSANQLVQVQRDTNNSRNATGTRHRNYFQFVYDNSELLPAGTYEGQVVLSGRGERR